MGNNDECNEVGGTSITISLPKITRETNYGCMMDVGYKGTAQRTSCALDTGNYYLIMPRWEDLKALSNFKSDYKVLYKDVQEPWRCPANIVKGPIILPAKDGTVTIDDCVFYVCTGDNDRGDRTANFGAGLSNHPLPKDKNGKDIAIKTPLAYSPSYRYAEVDHSYTSKSKLVLHPANSKPAGYTMLDILPSIGGGAMAVQVKSLTIDGQDQSKWVRSWNDPNVKGPPAFIDSGGGPVLVGDPNDKLTKGLPPTKTRPGWKSKSNWQFSNAPVTIVVQDDKGHTFKLNVDESPSGLTFIGGNDVFPKNNPPMMNAGGISFVSTSVIIDYVARQVGFKKQPTTTT